MGAQLPQKHWQDSYSGSVSTLSLEVTRLNPFQYQSEEAARKGGLENHPQIPWEIYFHVYEEPVK